MLQSLHQRENHERTLWRLRPFLPLSPPGLVVYVGVHNFAMSRPPSRSHGYNESGFRAISRSILHRLELLCPRSTELLCLTSNCTYVLSCLDERTACISIYSSDVCAFS